MKHDRETQLIHALVRDYNFSPRGGVEGLLVEIDGETAQIVFPDEEGTEIVKKVKPGKKAHFVVEPQPPSPKGEHAEHPVYHFHAIASAADRAKFKEGKEADREVFRGTVHRFNYAKHGEPNGVVLDTGDFIHMKPDGMRATELSVGDDVQAEGEAWEMELGHRIVEATVVNGVKMEKKKPKHK